MYKCRDCKVYFDAPILKTYTSGEYGDTTDCYCPWCGSENFEEVEECEGCGGWKKMNENVCISCSSYARQKLAAFARNFSQAILEEMDSILEGGSLMELLEG